ncbi:phage holin family protein [Sphingomicrobium sediminis]|uniref:Phage holin family protein n=1 Tax=Sphingomicrobium sediminis TaxID=2950949 RepID=A0A9X2EHL9_9SPHN|nr:phage holin family protein [Sphingomicrobium sediminis]MCM8556846.1 phage holin family protein [Sphingomicrobium sediminis]
MLDRPPSDNYDPDAEVGDLLGKVVGDARALAEAEIALARTRVMVEIGRYKVPVILFGIAMAFLTAALVAFAVGITLALSTLIGPLGAGLAATAMFVLVGGLLAYVGKSKLERGS